MKSFLGYIDYTVDGCPFYVGIGSQTRFQLLGHRNSKHDRVRRKHGQVRRLLFQSDDWEVTKRWETKTIEESKTYHSDGRLGCNFTRGGDGTLGWKPSAETKAVWSHQRKGNKWGQVPRPNAKGISKPKLSLALKGKKRPDLSIIMLGKKRGPYNVPEASRWKQGATNRGKPLSPEHRKNIGESGTGRKHTEATLQKLRSKTRTSEQKERYRLAALKRWERQRQQAPAQKL